MYFCQISCIEHLLQSGNIYTHYSKMFKQRNIKIDIVYETDSPP